MLRGNSEFPILFYSVKGVQQEQNSSYFNLDEQTYVVKLIQSLLSTKIRDSDGQLTRDVKESEIGVVSAYRKQVNDLDRIFKTKGWSDITVGTAETFQGKEKLVMIISTVRSDGRLGFLANYRVMLPL